MNSIPFFLRNMKFQKCVLFCLLEHSPGVVFVGVPNKELNMRLKVLTVGNTNILLIVEFHLRWPKRNQRL